MKNYIEILDADFKESKESDGKDYSKLEFLGAYIFDFITYDGEIDIYFSKKMINVISAILEKKTFEFIEKPENYIDFLTFINFNFLSDKLEWGTSIRGCWFDDSKHYDINRIEIESGELSIFLKDLLKWEKL